MRRGTVGAAIVGAAIVGAGSRCVPDFVCATDEQCDQQLGGRCEAGKCVYDAAAATTGAAATEASDPTGESGEPGETGETGASAPCHEFDLPLADTGKATGVALAADGTAYVVGVTSEAPWQLRIKRLGPTGDEVWSELVAPAELGITAFADRDTDIWARVFLAGDELTVVHSQREGEESEQDGVYVQTFAADTGASRVTSTLLVLGDRSLRGAATVGAGELVIAGETAENVWYQRVSRTDDTWSAQWADPPGISPPGGFFFPRIAQAIAPLGEGDEVMVGGSWDDGAESTDNPFRGWLRRIGADGKTGCSCDRAGAGVLALTAADGALYAGGFLQTPQADPDPPQAEWWLARMPVDCPQGCAATWELHEAGQSQYTNFYRAEFVQDAIYALAPVPGGVLAGGTGDNKPLVVEVGADGVEAWRMPPSGAAPKGAALALAVAKDGRCATIVGSVDYADYDARRWWVRRVSLP